AAQGRQPLLAREDRLGDVQRERHAGGFGGRMADISADQQHAGDVGGRDAQPVDEGERRVIGAGQRPGDEGQQDRGRARQRGERQGGPGRQGGGRQGRRRD